MAIAYNQFVIGIIKRKSLGDGFDRVGKTGTCFADFPYVRFLHLNSRRAKNSQRLGHATDLIGTALRKRRFEVAFSQGQHSLAQRREASDNVASDIEPYDQGRTDQA